MKALPKTLENVRRLRKSAQKAPREWESDFPAFSCYI